MKAPWRFLWPQVRAPREGIRRPRYRQEAQPLQIGVRTWSLLGEKRRPLARRRHQKETPKGRHFLLQENLRTSFATHRQIEVLRAMATSCFWFFKLENRAQSRLSWSRRFLNFISHLFISFLFVYVSLLIIIKVAIFCFLLCFRSSQTRGGLILLKFCILCACLIIHS